MVSTDPIADMLTRIRNAIAAGKTEIELPHSSVKETVAKILTDNGFLHGVSHDDKDGRKLLKIAIWNENSNPAITEINRLSTPGRRLYVGADDIPSIKQGRGVVIISTSKGMMTGREARQKRLGGELICQVY